MSRFRLVVADIDGTLLTRDREITPGVLAAVRAAQANGVRVCLATGRIWLSARQYFERLGADPPAILYNGGVMKGVVLRERLGEVVSSWTGGVLERLEGIDLDLAVSHGAAYYGLVRRGRGVRIRGGAARAYYIGVESAMPNCVPMPIMSGMISSGPRTHQATP